MKESKSSDKKLTELRGKIDKIDAELLKLLAKRTEYVDKVGDFKRRNGEKGSFIRPGREAVMLQKLVKKGAGKFPAEGITAIWRNIISASLMVENGLKIALLEKSGFDSARLTTSYFGGFSKYVLCKSTKEILEKTEKGAVGVLDITAGNWWAQLGTGKFSSIKVFAALGNGLFAAAVLAPEKTGHDKTLIVGKSGRKLGRELASWRDLALYEVDGFISGTEDETVIGSYA